MQFLVRFKIQMDYFSVSIEQMHVFFEHRISKKHQLYGFFAGSVTRRFLVDSSSILTSDSS